MADQVEILGVTTQNFDICPTAGEVFEKIKLEVSDMSTRDTHYVMEAMSVLDEMLGIEKTVVEKGKTSTKEITDMLSLNNDLLYYMGALDDTFSDITVENFEFTPMHIKQVMLPRNDINSAFLEEEEIKECIVELRLEDAT